MDDFFGDLYLKAYIALYGPKFCSHCGKVQPVQTFKLQGSDTSHVEGYELKIGFTGSQMCLVCYNRITEENENDSP